MWEWVFSVKMRPIRYAAGSSTEIVYTSGLQEMSKEMMNPNLLQSKITFGVIQQVKLTQFGRDAGQF